MSRLYDGIKKKKITLFFQIYGPLKIWAFKICQQDISKTIWATGLKLGQVIGDDEYITWLNLKKNHLLFPELWPFENLGILNLSAMYLKNYLS